MAKTAKMNDMTKIFLIEILQTEDAWDKKTRQLRRAHVLDMLLQLREARFLDQRLFQLMFRAVHLAQVLTSLPKEAFQEIELDGKVVTWFADEWLVDHFSGAGSYIGHLWSTDWAYEAPTEEEILSLGIVPSLVPARELKGGILQPALF